MARVFICKENLNQLERGIAEITYNANMMNVMTMKANYIYSFALFESTLTSTLRNYFVGFPEKLDKNIMISKKTLLSSHLTDNVLEDVINSYLRSKSSSTLLSYLEFYLKSMEIEIELDCIVMKQISDIRNILVHDAFKMKGTIDQSEKSESKCLEELRDKALYLKKILEKISYAMGEKYSEYTLEKVCRSIWSETFSTPLLKFDDVWVIKKDIIQIKNLDEIKSRIGSLASSEKVLLSIFLNQYSTSLNYRLFQNYELPAIYSLDSREKMVNLIWLLFKYPYLFNNEKLS